MRIRAASWRHAVQVCQRDELRVIGCFFLQNLSAGPSSVISAGRAGGAGPLLGSPQCGHTPSLIKGWGWRLVPAQPPNRYTTGCACSFAWKLLPTTGRQRRSGRPGPPGGGKDQGSSHGKLFLNVYFRPSEGKRRPSSTT